MSGRTDTGLALGQLSKKTPAALLRQEVEARTGMCQNMCDLGYKARRYSLVGEPVEFSQWGLAKIDQPHYVIKRTHGKQWRVLRMTGRVVKMARGSFPTTDKTFQSPVFPGPIAAAIWLQVEISNGNGISV